MTLGNRRAHQYISAARIALATAAVLGSFGCGEAAPEPESKVSRAESPLGSTKTQQPISNWTQLTQMVSDGNYLLTENLNAAGKTWNPIAFTGTFDGGDKTISNLTINSTGSGGFFKELNNAIVRRVRFTNLTVTDDYAAGGIAGSATDSLIELVGVQGTISAPNSFVVGGLVGMSYGTRFYQSFMRGTVTGALFNTGGITGMLGSTEANRGRIYQSYVWANVTSNAPAGVTYSKTGGIAGAMDGGFMQEVYVVGKVTGRHAVGGLVGEIGCSETNLFVVNHGIYRGDVIDQSKVPSSGGWAGTFGIVHPCSDRFDQLIWDSSRDQSTNWGTFSPTPQKSATNQQLISPDTVSGGIYYYPDNRYPTEIWDPGNTNQHHALKGMPGGLTIQPRCVDAAGVAYAC